MDYNQIKSFINLEIIGEEDRDKKYIFIFLLNTISIFYIFIFLLNTISIFYLKKSSTYGKLISTQFFLSIKIFYQLINYNNLDYKQIKIFIKLEIIGEQDFFFLKIISIF